MVKLDANVLRYMSKEEFRVLTAVEMGQKNHELVPTPLICRIAGLKSGGAFKVINSLHKNKLLFHQSEQYDGYRLTYMGYDYLALKAFVSRGVVAGLGRKIGVGKESDIYEVFNDAGDCMVMKIHRLGRTSFRSIKNNRDYMQGRKSASWLYMARLAALREYAYMKALYANDFPVPVPIDHNRHCIIMSRIYARPFAHAARLLHTGTCYSTLMNLIIRLAEHGLIHCDFNEFNLMIDKEENITMIDFPQMVSTTHENANSYFDRDVQCVRTYFLKRFKFDSIDFPRLEADTTRTATLDVALRASGCDPKELAAFEAFINDVNDGLVPQAEGDEGDEEDEGSEYEYEEGGAVVEEMEEEGAEVTAGDAGAAASLMAVEAPEVSGEVAGSGEVDEEEEGEGDEGDEEESDSGEEEEDLETAAERRRRKKALPPRKKKFVKKEKTEEEQAAKIAQHSKSAVARRNRTLGSAAAGSDAKRNTQKIFRNKEKKMIKAQMDSVGARIRGTAQ